MRGDALIAAAPELEGMELLRTRIQLQLTTFPSKEAAQPPLPHGPIQVSRDLHRNRLSSSRLFIYAVLFFFLYNV